MVQMLTMCMVSVRSEYLTRGISTQTPWHFPIEAIRGVFSVWRKTHVLKSSKPTMKLVLFIGHLTGCSNGWFSISFVSDVAVGPPVLEIYAATCCRLPPGQSHVHIVSTPPLSGK